MLPRFMPHDATSRRPLGRIAYVERGSGPVAMFVQIADISGR